MTEKIMRRGVRLPDSYHPDILELQTVADVLPAAKESFPWVRASATIREVRNWLQANGWSYDHRSILIVNEDQKQVLGLVTKAWIFENMNVDDSQPISKVASKAYSIYSDNSLQLAVEFLLKTKQDVLPVIERSSKELTGIISGHDILKAFEQRFHEENYPMRHISMKKSTLEILNSGKKIIQRTKDGGVSKKAKA
jgi:predicted transcriptional regulator